MSIQFASVRNVPREGEAPRVSSLIVSEPGFLQVVGVLPHNYRFEPESLAAADTLIGWLEDWKNQQLEDPR